MKKKITILIICLGLILAMSPLNILAEETTEDPVVEIQPVGEYQADADETIEIGILPEEVESYEVEPESLTVEEDIPYAVGFEDQETKDIIAYDEKEGSVEDDEFSVELDTQAAKDMMPYPADNLGNMSIKYSYMTVVEDGFMRVFYDVYNTKKICIEYYDGGYNIKSRKTLDMELDIWGGFFAGKDAYYLIQGKQNTAENDAAEVIRVIKYDKNWKRIKAAAIKKGDDFGGEVRTPFRSGCVEMAERSGKLYIATGHEGYVDPDYNQGHQGFLLIEVDEATMKGKIVASDLWHSFAQYIKADGKNLYVLEQSEGSRCTKVTRYDTATYGFEVVPVLRYGGNHTSAWAIACYASVDDMAVSSENVLCIGTSIDQSAYDKVTSDTAHNIYLTVTPKSDFTEKATKVKWLTDFSGDGAAFVGVKLTKINNDKFMVSWEEYEKSQDILGTDVMSKGILHYLFIDGNGNRIGKEYTAAAMISDCHPIVKGANVIYYASNANAVNFYKINSNTGQFSRKHYQSGGPRISWTVKNGVLSFKGTGKINIDTEVHYRHALSSSSRWSSYSNSDNCWDGIRDKVKKINIGSGITGIAAESFRWFDNLETVVVGKDVTSIDDYAFQYSYKLRKVYVPKNVKKFGKDLLLYTSVICDKGSPAHKYAQNNNFDVVLTSVKLNKASASVVKGKTLSLKATKILTTDPYNNTVKWSSKDTSIAKVDKNGKVTAVKPGTTTITATSANGRNKASCKVTVLNDTGLIKDAGVWKYFENGKFKKVTGLVKRPDNNKWYYVENGVFAKKTGLVKRIDNKKWYYVKSGDFSNITCVAGKVSGSDKSLYYVEKGHFETFTGQKNVGGTTYKFKGGKVVN